MESLWQDLRYGARMLAKHPTFTTVAVLTLALGIGANAAIFSVVNSVLLRPLPYADPDRLVMVWETIPAIGLKENTPASVNFINWRDNNRSFESMAAFTVGFTNLTGVGEPEKIDSVRASHNIFSLLGVEPLLGRAFTRDEDRPGASPVVMLSHSLWQRRFAGDPNIVNRTITLNDTSYTVVGVMPPNFKFPVLKSEMWVPIKFGPDHLKDMSRNYWVVARLNSGVAYTQAQAEMDVLTARAQQEMPSQFEYGANVVPLTEQVVGNVRPALLILLAATGLVLLIACANVANLMLARAASRHKEVAVRIALGASRWRLVRQLITESLLIAAAGGGAALFLAAWGVGLLAPLMPPSVADAGAVSIDRSVLLFTSAVSIITGVVFGLVPAIQATKPNLNEALKEGGRDSSAAARGWARGGLVVAETALALVLLVGAGLLMKSFVRLGSVDMGFQPENLLAAQVQLSSGKYKDESKRVAFFDELLGRLHALPGVKSAAVINGLPVSFQGGGALFFVEGRAEPQAQTPMSQYRIISPDYFRTMGISSISGRQFTATDRPDAEPVAIISESLARQSWPNQDPLGSRIRWGSEGQYMKIVGVVSDVKLAMTAEAKPHVYIPYTQIDLAPYEVVIRTEGDPSGLADAVRNEVWAIDKDQPVANLRTVEQMLSNSISRHRFNMLLLSIFAGLALLLAAVGLYGVMSYTVAQGTREIGIRMALGAKGSDVLKLVVGKGGMLTLAGIAVGIVASFGLTRLMQGLLFEVSATDPVIFVVISLMLAAVALAATLIPARRATRVDPMVALRYE